MASHKSKYLIYDKDSIFNILKNNNFSINVLIIYYSDEHT